MVLFHDDRKEDYVHQSDIPQIRNGLSFSKGTASAEPSCFRHLWLRTMRDVTVRPGRTVT